MMNTQLTPTTVFPFRVNQQTLNVPGDWNSAIWYTAQFFALIISAQKN